MKFGAFFLNMRDIVLSAIDNIIGCNGRPELFAESNTSAYKIGEEVARLIKKEIVRRESFVKDELIGQSPEDLERHYRLIGRKEAFRGLIEFIGDELSI